MNSPSEQLQYAKLSAKMRVLWLVFSTTPASTARGDSCKLLNAPDQHPRKSEELERAAPGLVGGFGEAGHEVHEVLRLPDKGAHINEALKCILGGMPGFGRSNDGANRQALKEHRWFGHDQVIQQV